jgi:hypothetical protein
VPWQFPGLSDRVVLANCCDSDNHVLAIQLVKSDAVLTFSASLCVLRLCG